MKIIRLNLLTALLVFLPFHHFDNALGQTEINIGYPGAVGLALIVPLSVAQSQGLFLKNGMMPQLVFLRGTFAATMRTGEVQFGFMGAPAAMRDASRGIDLRVLASFATGRLSNHLVARPEIKRPEDLRGARFGVLGIGTGIWIQTVLALEQLGLDLRRDHLTFLSIGDLAQNAQALEAGTIDAAVLSPGQSAQLRAKGFSVLLDLYAANMFGPQNALTVTAPYLRQQPEVVEKVVAALVEAVAFSLAPKNKSTVLNTIMKEFRLTDIAVAETNYQTLFLDVARKPYPSLEKLKNMQRIMALHDPSILKLKVEDIIEDRFVKKFDESGFTDRLYKTYEVK